MRCLLNAYSCDKNVVIMFACSKHDQILIAHINGYTCKMIHRKARLGYLACGSLYNQWRRRLLRG